VTISVYNGAMPAEADIGIAEIKGKLSEYLRIVRRGGEVVIKDRETPIARLVPFEESRPRLETTPPTMSLKELDKLPFFRPKGLKPGDLDEALREERQDRF
jgi:prevent-host-death family protein